VPTTARAHLARHLGPALVALAAAACAGPHAIAPRPAAASASAIPAAPRHPAAEARRRADDATRALVARFWNGRAFSASSPGDGRTTPYWTSAQALDAMLDALAREADPRLRDLVRAAFAEQDARGWTREWFDDECWMAIALLRAHDLTGEAAYFARARALVEDVATHAVDPAAPGLWWDRAHTQKATAANAGAVIAAARLAERTGDATWLDFARRTYAHWRAAMVDPATFQVADHVDARGRVSWWRFTYNEGTMIGAALALHRATREARYLEDARAIAGFALARETESTPVGDVLSDGAACRGDCEQFKGIAYRYLAALAAADPANARLAAVLGASAEAVWTLARDPATGLFGTSWSGPPPAGATSLPDQTSAAMVLNLAAVAPGA
jgi:predicted alpha-1,6-mannanase (GH76 family)